jgi:hypothetical protein
MRVFWCLLAVMSTGCSCLCRPTPPTMPSVTPRPGSIGGAPRAVYGGVIDRHIDEVWVSAQRDVKAIQDGIAVGPTGRIWFRKAQQGAALKPARLVSVPREQEGERLGSYEGYVYIPATYEREIPEDVLKGRREAIAGPSPDKIFRVFENALSEEYTFIAPEFRRRSVEFLAGQDSASGYLVFRTKADVLSDEPPRVRVRVDAQLFPRAGEATDLPDIPTARDFLRRLQQAVEGAGSST